MLRPLALFVTASGALAAAAPAAAQTLPPLVAAYVEQLARSCGGGGSAQGIVERADLNGDRREDFVVDAARYPCPGRPAALADAGSQVTVFRSVSDTVAVPAFQAASYGMRLRRSPDGARQLWVTLGGADCGETVASARCERRIVWRNERFEADRAAPPPV